MSKDIEKELQENSGLKEAVDAKVQMNWAERIEGFITSYEEFVKEAQMVIDANTVIKDIAEASGRDKERLVRKSIEGFDYIINNQKVTIDTINLKLTAARRLRVLITENKTVAINEFLTDFDIVAGQAK